MKRIIFIEGKKKLPKKYQHLLFKGETVEEFLKEVRTKDEIVFIHHDRVLISNLILMVNNNHKNIEFIRQ